MALTPQINQSTLDEAFFILLTITDAETGQILRVVNNNEQVTSRGNTFEPYPFAITLASDVDDQTRRATITIDNVDRAIVEYVRRSLEPPLVKIELILSGTPNTVEKTLDFLRLVSVEYDAFAVRGTLEPHDFLNLPAVDSAYDGTQFPDLMYN